MSTADRMFIITAWFESIFYGINCVLFGVCMYILFNRNKRTHWIIPASCILHISIATAHNIIFLLRVLQAFANPTIISIPNGSTLYINRMGTALSLTNWGLDILNELAVNILLVWRFYVIWQHIWILIFLLILLTAHVALAITAWSLVLRFSDAFSHGEETFGNACSVLNVALTVFVTSGIAYRIWRAGQAVSDLTGRNIHKSAMFIVIESGALYTISFLVQTILLMSHSLAGVMTMNVTVQIATMTPLLLIARLALGMMHGEATKPESSTFAQPIQVNITEEVCTYPTDTVDCSSESTRKSIQLYPNPSAKKISLR